MDEPEYYRGRKHIEASLDAVVEFVLLLEKTKGLSEFRKVAAGHTLRISPEVANLAKQFLFERGVHRKSAFAATVVGKRKKNCPDPYRCPHIPRGR